MNKQVLVLALLVVLSSCWTITIDRTPVSQGDLPIKEEILTTKVNFGTQKVAQIVPTAIDLASDDTWILEKSQCVDCVSDSNVELFDMKQNKDAKITNKTGGLFYGFAGQVQFTSVKNGTDKLVYSIGSDNVVIGNNTVSNLNLYYPHAVLQNSKTSPKYNILNTVQASIGLGQSQPADGNTLTNLLSNQSLNSEKLQGTDEFSIYLNKNGINEIRVGYPEKFFKKGEWNSFKFIKGTSSQELNAYSLAVDSIVVGEKTINVAVDSEKQDESEVETDIPTHALITTTSKFYTVSDLTMLNTIASFINAANKNANCKEVESNYLYVCSKGTSDYPEITLNLKDATGKSKSLTIKPENYLEEYTVKGETKNVLLFRRGVYGYQNFQASNFASTHYIWLGTAFLDQFYVNVQNKAGIVQIADKYQFENQNSWISEHWRLLLLIVGGVLLLALIGALIFMMSKVPYDEKQNKHTKIDGNEADSFNRLSYRAQLANPQFLSSEQGFSKVTDSPIRKIAHDPMYGSKAYNQQAPQYVIPQQIPQQPQQQMSPGSYNQRYIPRY